MADAFFGDQPPLSRHVKMSKVEDFDFPHCRDQSVVYEKLTKIGQGTFG